MKRLDISVIIPFKDKATMTLQAVNSLLKYGPGVREILLISNNSNKDELVKIRDAVKILSFKNINILEYNQPFNYQKMNNWAVGFTKGRYILFLNNDTEFVQMSSGLIDKMVEKASKSTVGITGCLLLYGDNLTIQHAGVFLVPMGTADHLYVGQKLKTVRKFIGSKKFPYDIAKDAPMTAVTGAVSLIERKKFQLIGGFDEKFVVCGGDVDLCIRLNKAGYQTWYVAGGYIIHKESQSREQKPVSYNDFYYSYLSYIKGYDTKVGDPFLPLITKGI